MNDSDDVVGIENEISRLGESDFRKLIVNFLKYEGYTVTHTHGNNEEGVDIIAQLDQGLDPFGIGTVVFLQVKVGDIKMKSWRNDLHSQIIDTVFRPINLPNCSEHISKRIILVTSGLVNQNVINSLNNFNSRMPLSIEIIDGHHFARIFCKKYTIEDIQSFVNNTSIKKPPSDYSKGFVGLIENYPKDTIEIKEIGSDES